MNIYISDASSNKKAVKFTTDLLIGWHDWVYTLESRYQQNVIADATENHEQ